MLQQTLFLLFLLSTTYSQCDSQAFCMSLLKQSKLFLAQNQKRELPLSDYILGFNLTYSIDANVQGVSLNTQLTKLSNTSTSCGQGQTLMTYNKSRFGILVRTQQGICVETATINANRSITIERRYIQKAQGLVDCLVIAFLQNGKVFVQCQNITHRVSYVLWQASVYETAMELKDPILKSVVYNKAGKDYLVQITYELMNLWSFSQDNCMLLTSLNAQDFKNPRANFTDIVIVNPDNFVLVDYSQGCLRFSLDSENNPTHLSSYFTVKPRKLSYSGSHYFILSEMTLVEIYWPHTPLNPEISAVYDIPTCENVLSFSVNQQLIVIEADTAVYIYQRGVTVYRQILAKYVGRIEVMLHEEEPWFFMVGEDCSLQTYAYQSGYLRINETVETMSFNLTAVSHDLTSVTCSVRIILENIKDIYEVYETLTPPGAKYRIPSDQTLQIPLSQGFQGLDLTFSSPTNPLLHNYIRKISHQQLISVYLKSQILTVKTINSKDFYRLTTDDNCVNIEICEDRGNVIICMPVRVKRFEGRVTQIRLFDNVFYGILFTYMTEDLRTIWIEDIRGQEVNIKFTVEADKEVDMEFLTIDDYVIKNQFIIVTHKMINRVDIYRINTQQLQTSITNTISNGILFKPQSIKVSGRHSQLLFIKNPNSLIIVTFINSQPILKSIIHVNISNIHEQWVFVCEHSSMFIIYQNRIEQHSLNDLENPVVLKEIPLMNRTIVTPIEIRHEDGYVIVKTIGDGGQSGLLVLRMGQGQCSSVLYVVPMQLDSWFEMVLTTDLLLLTQEETNHHKIERIYLNVDLIVTPMLKESNDFVEQFQLNFSVISHANTSITKQVNLTIVNYQRLIKARDESAKEEKILPAQADGLELTFNDTDWFQGPLIWYQLECDYCPEKFVPTYHIKRLADNSLINNTIHILPSDNQFHFLTNKQVITTTRSFKITQNVSLPAASLLDRCSHLTKYRKWLFVLCQNITNPNDTSSYSIPVDLEKNQTIPYKILNLTQKIGNPLKSVVIEDMLLVLDNQIIADKFGVIRVYRIFYAEDEITSINYQMIIDKDTFGSKSYDAKINGFDYIRTPNSKIYHFYFTLSTVGIITCTISFQQSINITSCTTLNYIESIPSFLQKYSIQDNLILQVKLIGCDRTNNKVTHTVIVTTAQAAHLQLSIQYQQDPNTFNLKHINTNLIQAFNSYGDEVVLNWMDSLYYNSDTEENMFVVGYLNDSNAFVSLGIYPLVSNYTYVPHFQNIKGGSFIETTDHNIFSAYLLPPLSSSSKPLLFYNILPNSIMNRLSQPVLNQLSNNITLTVTYDRPSDDRVIVFHAINDYGEATFKYKISYEADGELSWYWVLGLLVGLVLGLVMACLGYRWWRLRRQRKEKESLMQQNILSDQQNMFSQSNKSEPSSDKNTI